jgi:hypothetical protein
MRLASNVSFLAGATLTLAAFSTMGMAATPPTPEVTPSPIAEVITIETVEPTVGPTIEPTTEPTPMPTVTESAPLVVEVKERTHTERPTSTEVTIEPPLPTYTLPPCEQEDSDNCYWDATRMGNRAGTSFITLNGVTYYPNR